MHFTDQHGLLGLPGNMRKRLILNATRPDSALQNGMNLGHPLGWEGIEPLTTTLPVTRPIKPDTGDRQYRTGDVERVDRRCPHRLYQSDQSDYEADRLSGGS
jgi:hypothetical protein